jgi:hypothetical protein
MGVNTSLIGQDLRRTGTGQSSYYETLLVE